MTLDQAIELVIDGSAVLFLGAGFSKGATNRRGSNFKLAGEFAEHLARMAGAPPESPLQDAAESYRAKFGTLAFSKRFAKNIPQLASHPSISKSPRLLGEEYTRPITTTFTNFRKPREKSLAIKQMHFLFLFRRTS